MSENNKYIDYIAVVTPVYNGEKTIQRSINSLVMQTFQNWICIIVNDGSTDNTKVILDKYKDDERFIIIHLNKNHGRPYARNVALEKVKSINARYMCMLDADDLYYPNKLEWQFSYMERYKDISLASSSLGLINLDFQLVGVLGSYNEKIFTYNSFEDFTKIPHASSIIRVQDIGNHIFDEDMYLGEDSEFLMRLLLNKRYVFIPKISYLYSRENSFSIEKYKLSHYYAVKSAKKNNMKKKYLLNIYLSYYLKILILVSLKSLGLLRFYFNNIISRKPTKEEINEHYIQIEKIKNTSSEFS